MNARTCLDETIRLGKHYQLAINDFVDEFRRATATTQRDMIHEGASIDEHGDLRAQKLTALVAAVVSALAREAGLEAPGWIVDVISPEPFFVLPAQSYAMRVRLMLESPPPFKNRRVFVPENYLSRA